MVGEYGLAQINCGYYHYQYNISIYFLLFIIIHLLLAHIE